MAGQNPATHIRTSRELEESSFTFIYHIAMFTIAILAVLTWHHKKARQMRHRHLVGELFGLRIFLVFGLIRRVRHPRGLRIVAQCLNISVNSLENAR